ncbi:unnamed protein product, partial [Meganyctiphanes norvegica]
MEMTALNRPKNPNKITQNIIVHHPSLDHPSSDFNSMIPFDMKIVRETIYEKDVVSWGRWVCQREGIQDLDIDLSMLDTLNGQVLFQTSQQELELMFGCDLGHIFYAYLPDRDFEKISYSLLPLTVEELNKTIPGDDFTPICDDNNNTEYDRNIFKQNQTYDMEIEHNFPNNHEKNNNRQYDDQPDETYYYSGDLHIPDERIPDLSVLGAYCDLESDITGAYHIKVNGGCEQDREQNILSQDLCKKIVTTSRRKERSAKNWEFLVRLLADPRTNPELVSWVDISKGTFRLVQPHAVVALWNAKSKKSPISYHSFARGLRYHYKSGTLCLVAERHLMYGFGPEALNYLQELLKKDSRTMSDYR